ncbi:tRNA-specific 2-thiouridylase [Candidatus Pacearchaeota archaeon]|nr:tRNA-specific 2-thiouridylase [Candidatus Pacearchaeota archaeon]
MKTKPKVLVAMSGGVDSSVAALMMKNRGFQILGVFMKNYSDSKNDFTGDCLWKDERRIAMKIAAKLGIPLITLDFEKQYKKLVIEKMFSDYRKGITPNPDIDCNQKVKFPLLIKAAKKLGCDFVATGHYARIKKIVTKNDNNKISNVKNKLFNKNHKDLIINSHGAGWREAKKWNEKKVKYQLLRATDESKDQSYFLYRLKQDELKHLIFPIGDYTKKQIREIARKNHFLNYDKKSTVGICFVGKVNLKKFLQARIAPKKGKILNPQGEIMGEHDGIYYYTIGQRIGMRFGIDVSKKHDDKNLMKRWYVAKKDVKKNTIIAAPEGHPLNYRKEIWLKNQSWINADEIINTKTKRLTNKQIIDINLNSRGRAGENKTKKQNENSKKILARIRQVGELLSAKIENRSGKIKVILDKAITGISEGQAIVLYDGKEVLGGGEIRFN